MQLKTILNQVTDYTSFVIEKLTWVENSVVTAVEVQILPPRNAHRV
mgnify:CR=1 FL=1